MSQKKVDLYKEEKKNRQKIMKREKFQARLSIIISVVVLAALVGWFGWAVYNNRKESAEAAAGNQTTTLDLTAMQDYQSKVGDYANKEKDSASGTSSSSESVTSGSEETASTSAETAASTSAASN